VQIGDGYDMRCALVSGNNTTAERMAVLAGALRETGLPE
jgi:hypothetical protein